MKTDDLAADVTSITVLCSLATTTAWRKYQNKAHSEYMDDHAVWLCQRMYRVSLPRCSNQPLSLPHLAAFSVNQRTHLVA